MELKRIKKPENREQWLMVAVELLRPLFRSWTIGAAVIPDVVKVSTGWPKGGRGKAIGQCWPSSAADDRSANIFISPEIEDSVQVLGVLVHELVHAADDCKNSHQGRFARWARQMELAGPLVATTPAALLEMRLQEIIERIGPYPHSKLSLVTKTTQTTRMLKVQCPVDDYFVRMTQKWIDEMGCPTCPCGTEMLRCN